MERKIIDRHVFISITDDYKLTVGQLKASKNLLDSDEIIAITKGTEPIRPWRMDEHERDVIGVTVVRSMPESDDEFFARAKQEEEYRKRTEEKERLEYLRLKAKFEN